MKRDDDILSAVLDESATIREATLAQVRTLARRRRVVRSARRIVAATIVLGAIIAVFRPRMDAPADVSVQIVRSEQTVPRVRSVDGGFAPVRTQRMAFVAAEPVSAIRIVRTRDAPASFETLNDRELLALFPGRVMLVSPGTPEARLIVY